MQNVSHDEIIIASEFYSDLTILANIITKMPNILAMRSELWQVESGRQ